ncbi:Flp pilus assembly protein TadG [Phycicoccus badiiscoriae]|uniref:Flp pilus assembly protein TadG n=1 Tax=Pedococcus badiiscoriae TaxID=642776 RepID=A0A852WR55_9MICO|nr:Flp pilus assembly protein TadG [Pedococcus badiiscoriae]
MTPVFVAMLFGIIEFGMLFKDYLGSQAMIRAGVRLASAEPRTATFAQDAANQMRQTGTVIQPGDIQALWVYKANATDDFPITYSNFSDCTVCVKFQWDSSLNKFTPSYTNWTASQQNACTAASGGPPDRIGVYVRVRHNSITGIIGPVTISEASAMFLEPFPALSGCK